MVSMVLVFVMVLSLLVDVTPKVYATEVILRNPVRNEDEGITEWDSIYFGNYYQTEYSPQVEPEHPVDGQVYTDIDGTKYICKTDLAYYKYEDIKWRVLSVGEDDVAFLMADSLLEMKAYDEIYKENGTSWEECTLRKWLNDIFYDLAFTEDEKGAIIEHTVINEANPEYGTSSGNDTRDNVYIPSLSEMTNTNYGFTDDVHMDCAGRYCELSDYAKTTYYSDWFEDGMTNMYFLRTAGVDECDVVYVYDGGNVVNASCGRATGHFLGVCPVINVDIAGYEGWSNAGTYSSTGEYTEATDKTTVDNPASEYDEQTYMTTTTWDCINFGKYYQSLYEPQNEPDNPVNGQVYTDTDGTQYLCKTSGTKYYKYQNIKWRVLSVGENEAFVIADQILDMRVFNEPVDEDEDDTSWEECTLRTWLNDTFYIAAFTEAEQGAILETTVENTENFEQETTSGNNTTDKIYLLSMDEAVNISYGFNGSMWDDGLFRENTAYSMSLWKHDWENSGSSPWFLRTSGSYENDVAYIYYDNIASGSGGRASGYVYGICPVLNIDLSNENVWSYAGKIESNSSEEGDEDYEDYGGYEYVLINEGTEVEITGYTGTATELVIPSVIDGKSVTSIGNGCFELGEEEESTITDIAIPDSVTNIGRYAFYGCSSLTNITIPESITSIGESAFEDCTGLTSIKMPKNVTSIEYGVFQGCSGLTDITLPESVTSIGDYAFRGCRGLTDITIPESVTSIGMYAFEGCAELTDITIPKSVISIDGQVFGDCAGLISIKVDDENPIYNSNGNCNAIIEANTLISGCVNTIIPESVTSIGDSAFEGCSGLTDITIPENVKSIGGFAFRDCIGLRNITIPKNVTSIGDSAFEGCSRLTSIKVDDGNSMYNSDGNCNAIIDTKSNTLIRGCVNTIIPESVTSIGDSAFDECTELTDITIPESVTSIGWYAFKGCTGLTDITIPESVTSIGGGAFEIYDGLNDVYIYNTVIHGYKNSAAQRYAEEHGMVFKILGEKGHTFSTEYTIDTPATCAKEGSKSRHCTDEGCTEKTDVTVIPATGQHTYDAGVIQTLPTCVDKGSKLYTCTICKQTKTEEIAATGTHTYDTGVIQTLPTCVDKGSKLYTCTVCKQTKTEEIGETGTHAFGDWVETKAPTIDEKGEKTRTCTTCNHQEKEEIAEIGHVKGASFVKGSAEYTIDTVKGKKGTVTYEGTTKDNAKKVTIPTTVTIEGKKYTVTEVADNAFKGNTKIKEVVISKNVTKIGKNAFSGCKNLKKITIKSTKLKSVGKNAFKNIKKDTTIKVPKKQYSKYKKMIAKKNTGYKKTMKIKK